MVPTHQGQGKYGRFSPWVREKAIIFAKKSQGKSGNFFLNNAYEPCNRLVVTGHDGLDDEDRKDRIVCQQFIKGLRPEIKETVWEKCPHSFQEAITAAERREVYLTSMGRRSWVNDISEDLLMSIQQLNKESKSNDEIWKAIQNLTSVVQTLAVQRVSPAPQQPQRQGTQRPRCFKCNQPGHIK